MKAIVILCGEDCVYCKKAKMLVERAIEKEPKFKVVDVSFIMEESEIGKSYKHELVPAFYLDREMVFEGNPDMKLVTSLLQECYDSFFQ